MIEKTAYLDAFSRMSKELKDEFTLVGDVLLVERLKEEEIKTAGGLIVPGKDSKTGGYVATMSADYPELVRILVVGQGYYDPETDKDIPMQWKAGDIVVVGQQSVQWFPVFGSLTNVKHSYQIGLMRENQIKLKFNGHEGYEKIFQFLNQTL